MELAVLERSVVVVIDLQGKLVEQVHRPELVAAATRRLMRLAGLFEVPVVLTEQYPRGLGATRADILEAFEALPTAKRRFEKVAFGCFGEPGFAELLAELRPGLPPGRMQLIVAGIDPHPALCRGFDPCRVVAFGGGMKGANFCDSKRTEEDVALPEKQSCRCNGCEKQCCADILRKWR